MNVPMLKFGFYRTFLACGRSTQSAEAENRIKKITDLRADKRRHNHPEYPENLLILAFKIKQKLKAVIET